MKNYGAGTVVIIIAVVCWGLTLFINVLGLTVRRRGVSAGPTDFPFFFVAALVATIVAVAMVARHVSAVRRVFARGRNVVGRVTNVSAFQNSVTVRYSYVVDGREHQKKAGIAAGLVGRELANSFRPGAEIELVVDEADPSKAFVKKLYL